MGSTSGEAERDKSAAMPASPRRLDLDRLRTLACFSTFFYHSIQIFDLNPYYHIKSATPSVAIDIAARLLHTIRMPLFFLLAGVVMLVPIKRLGNLAFLRARAARLMPPFILGIVLLTPWIKYLEVLDGRSITWSGIQYYTGPPPDLSFVLGRYFTRFKWFSWSHMWFPLYLLLLSAVMLPAVRRMAAASDQGPKTVTALLCPLAALLFIELLLRPIFPWHIPNLFWDWASVSVYAVLLLWGVALMRWHKLEHALWRLWPVTAMSALVGTVLYVGIDAGWPWQGAGRALWLWGAMCTAIGCGPFLARGRIPGEAYFVEGALPIYVLHHLPLVAIGFLVKDLPWPIWQRYFVILFGALLTTLAVYHCLVRPYGLMRVAFGMPRSPEKRPLAPAAVGQPDPPFPQAR